jgi:transcriptional regulator with XRE-family HTH domain
LLAERGWTRRTLAEAASIRPNTLTNIIKHGRAADLATLGRIADALSVDIAELFLTSEQSAVLHAHRQSNVERLREMVVRELSDTVTTLVEKELARLGQFSLLEADQKHKEYRSTRRSAVNKTKPKKRKPV